MRARAVPHLAEVAMQQASIQVGGRLDQFEKSHKVITVQRSKSLHCEFHLKGVPDCRVELLYFSDE